MNVRSGNASRVSASSGELRVEQPDVVREAATLHLAQPTPVALVEQEVPRYLAPGVVRVALVPHDVEADAREAPGRGFEMAVERAPDTVGTGEVGPSHDPGGDARAVAVRRGARHVADDELGLADGAERLVAVGPERCHALDEHGGFDVVPAPEIGIERRCVVGDAVASGPEMVVRVDDRQIGVDDLLQWRVLTVDLGEVHGRWSPVRVGASDPSHGRVGRPARVVAACRTSP